MENELILRSGAKIKQMESAEAAERKYLTRHTLSQMHLMPTGDPVAYDVSPSGDIIYYFDPSRVSEAPPETWYFPNARRESMTLPSGSIIERMSIKNAATRGYYTESRLKNMHYEVIEEPVAYTYKADKSILYFYDKKTAKRLPLMCVQCGKAIRYKKKLCEACYEKEMEIKRAEGNAYRASFFNMDRAKVLFFDLELTGFYDRDEILSITIVDGFGNMIMDTLVKPVRIKSWKKTEKIHGIYPSMVENAPTMDELIPELIRIFDGAENVIAYGVSTDYSHIKYIYTDAAERENFHKKIRCCANEFVRYAHENRPDIVHASLTDAMSCFEIEWEGVAHSSIADTLGCRKVWEALFPNYYKN
ncbi:MAG: 3'-5' exonuclease [Clostridia bacterium]|nr:3'-5' exonuclease [Clostridia bacterium]